MWLLEAEEAWLEAAGCAIACADADDVIVLQEGDGREEMKAGGFRLVVTSHRRAQRHQLFVHFVEPRRLGRLLLLRLHSLLLSLDQLVLGLGEVALKGDHLGGQGVVAPAHRGHSAQHPAHRPLQLPQSPPTSCSGGCCGGLVLSWGWCGWVRRSAAQSTMPTALAIA